MRRPRQTAANGNGAFRKQKWDLLLIATAALYLVSVARVHTLIPGLTIFRPALILTGVGALAYALNHRGIRSWRRFNHPLGYLAGFFVVWATLGAPFALYPTRAVMYLLNEFLRTTVIFVLAAAAVRNMHDIRRLLQVAAVGGVLFSVFAVTPGFRGLGAGGYDPNDSAMFLVGALPLITYFAIRSKNVLAKAIFAFGVFACAGAIVTSGSRGAFLALIAVVAYLLFFYRAVTPAIRLASVAGIVAVVGYSATGEFWERMESITDDDDYNRHSVTGREQLWSRGIEYTMANPVFGVGTHNFSVAEGRHPAIVYRIERGWGTRYGVVHSMWIQASSEQGIPGFIAFIGLFVVSVLCLYRIAKIGGGPRAPPHLRQAAEMSGAMIGMFIGLMVAGTFLSQAYFSMIWGPLGLTLGMFKVMRLHGVEVWGKGWERKSRQAISAAAPRRRGSPRPAMQPAAAAAHRGVAR